MKLRIVVVLVAVMAFTVVVATPRHLDASPLDGGEGVRAAPGAPTNFAVATNGNGLSMSWTAPAGSPEDAPTSYNLLARTASGGPVILTLPLGNVTTFAVNAPNGTFFLSVQGTNASGPGPESNVVAVTVPTLPPLPGSPTGLVVSVVGNRATFMWNAPTNGGPVGNYVLLAGNAPFPAPSLASLTLPPSPTAVAINNVPPGTWYARIFARNAAGNSAFSTNQVQLTVGAAQAPGVPTLNTPVVLNRNVTLSWAPGPGGTPTSYTLVVRTSPAGAPILNVPVSGTGASFANAPSGTFYLQLVANNGLGSSAPSNQVALVVP